MTAILHISDLHRSPDDPISNDELLSTLVADRDRYVAESPPVPPPQSIIVSGDLVHGVPLAAADPDAELADQYDVALDFLCRLTEAFAGGDRRRVVVVPGNHDVSWPIAQSAMSPVDDATVHELSPRAFGPTSDLRWDWRDRKVYRISDRARYEARMRHYTATVNAFYDGLDLPFPTTNHPYYRLYELIDGRIGVAAFNSCAGNDCYAFHGAIPEEALARAHLQLHERQARYDLLLAVWHHNVDGAPYTSDYMDIANVYRLIGKGFRLGLHGHQHRAEMGVRYIHLPDQVPMAVISAGSLCAGQRDLPMGVHRQYNIVELDDALSSARVHVREMAISTVFGPAQRTEFGGKSYVDLVWGNHHAESARQAREGAATFAAEQAIGEARFGDAVAVLCAMHPAPGTYPRALLVRALREGADSARAVEALPEPADADEVVLLVRAHVGLGNHDEAVALLDRKADVLGMPEATVRELRSWIDAQRQMAR